MKRLLLTLFCVTITALQASAATNNTSGPWGVDAAAFTNLSTALSSPATAGKTVVVTKPMAINTITTDRSIRVEKGGSIDVSAGKVFTTSGPFEAGAHQVFNGSGTVGLTGGAVSRVYAEWWGAKGDGVTNDTAPIENALDTGKTVLLLEKTYKCNITIDHNGSHLEGRLGYFNTTGDPVGGTILRPYVGTSPVININAGDPTDGIILKGLSFVGDGTGVGLRLEYVRHSVFQDLNFHDFTTCIHAEQINWMNNYTNIQMYWFSTAGFYLNNGSEDSQFVNCLARGYQSASIGLKINYYCQLNNFTSCDFSDNKFNVYIELSAAAGGNKPIISFDSCIFEQGSTEGQGFANSAGFIINAPDNVDRKVVCIVNLTGCRFLYKDSTTLSTSNCFLLYGNGDIDINITGTNVSNYPTVFKRITGPGYTYIKGSIITLGTTLYTGFTSGTLQTDVKIVSADSLDRFKSLSATTGEYIGSWDFATGNLVIDVSDIGTNGVIKLYVKRVTASTSTQFGEFTIQEKGGGTNCVATENTDVAAVYSASTAGNVVTISNSASPAPVVLYKIIKIL